MVLLLRLSREYFSCRKEVKLMANRSGKGRKPSANTLSSRRHRPPVVPNQPQKKNGRSGIMVVDARGKKRFV